MIPTIFGGGVNLEATWISLSTTFFIKKGKKFFYFAVVYALSISILYSSRAGFIIALLSFLLYFLSGSTSNKEKFLLLISSGIIILFSLVFLVAYMEDVYVLKRFTEIGSSNDGGSVGRLMLWENIDRALFDNFFTGYGAGNSIYAIEKAGNFDFTENNIHNYYLQVLLEFGFVGFIIYSIFTFYVVGSQIKCKFTNPYGNFMLLYFIGSLVQFRGAEAIVWLVVGIYFAQKRNNSDKDIPHELQD